MQRWRRVRQFLATTGFWELPDDRGVQRWRRVRQFVRGCFLGAWFATGIELAQGVSGAGRPWALAYFVVFGLFLVIDIGVSRSRRRTLSSSAGRGGGASH